MAANTNEKTNMPGRASRITRLRETHLCAVCGSRTTYWLEDRRGEGEPSYAICKPCFVGQCIADFFAAVDAISRMEPVYVPQPHEWQYAATRPYSAIDVQIPGAHLMKQPPDARDAGGRRIWTVVVVPYQLHPEMARAYELTFLRKGERALEGGI